MIRFNNDRAALIWPDETVTYAEFRRRVEHYRRRLDIAPGDRVAIFAENRPEWVVAFYAVWRRQGIPVPVDFMSSAADVAYILADCTPGHIFISRARRPVLDEALNQLEVRPRILEFEAIPAADLSAMETDEWPEPDPDRTAVIIYTSGTTGTPKGVMLSFGNLQANFRGVSHDVPIYTEHDRVLAILPLHHVFPLLGAMALPLYTGGSVVFCPSLAAADIIATLQAHRVTIIIGVPRLYHLMRRGIMDKINARAPLRALFRLAERVNSRRFSRLLFGSVHRKFGGAVRYMVAGGAALGLETGRDFTTLGFEILEGYGMTEAAPMISFPRPGKVKLGTTGQPLPGTEVRLVDGEVTARGPNIMQGYYNRPAETGDVLRDGWLHTGDLGVMDDEGYLTITGRKKEIIVLPNGKNVNPELVEQQVLAMAPVLSEVGVFATPGGQLQALVVADPEQCRQQAINDIRAHLRHDLQAVYNRQVSPYKRIYKITLQEDPLPRTRLGKLKRYLLPDMAVAAARETGSRVRVPDSREYEIIRDYLRTLTGGDVMPDDHLELDLGLDSLDRVAFQAFLQTTFGMEFNETELAAPGTVRRLAEHVARHKVRITVDTLDWGTILRQPVDVTLPRSWFMHIWFKYISKLYLKCFFRLKKEGVEKLPDSPFILAANHQSFIDGLFVAVFLKNFQLRHTYFYAKAEHIRRRWLKFLADRNNVIIMDLNNDLRQSLHKLAEVLRRRCNIIIFPEGTRSRDGKLGNFKKTFAILSRELNVPIVPVAIQGAFEAMPKGVFFPRLWKPVTVKFLDPVYPDESHTYDSLLQQVFARLEENLA
ncbi:MAG: AMP-binding protein [Acidobacteria bacterium]|nr:AMP-binding protein [Acidobacteriota bacterium]